MISQIIRPVSHAVRAAGQRAILRSSAAPLSSIRLGSQVAHQEEKTPRQEEEENKTTMDFQNTPEGPWEEGMARQQAYYNKVLIGGVVVFGLTLILGKVLRDDMYWIDPKFPMTNPPLFTMAEMRKEALAKCLAEAEEEEEEEEDE